VINIVTKTFETNDTIKTLILNKNSKTNRKKHVTVEWKKRCLCNSRNFCNVSRFDEGVNLNLMNSSICVLRT